jgi:hypothetical protein
MLCGFWTLPLQAQNRYDIVIDELMADPSPVVGLPNNEWIELKNVTGHVINLQGWRISDLTSTSGPLPSFVLQPDSFLIVCSSGALNTMSAFGTAISVTSFPSLDNDGDLITLRSSTGKVIYAVNYAVAWYESELKKDGGWSLEMKDPASPCTSKQNWTASISTSGGTPGKKNTVDAWITDQTGPRLLRSYSTDSLTVVLVFDEPVDSLAATDPAHYRFSNPLNPLSIRTDPPLFNTVTIRLNAAMQTGNVYDITAMNIPDCRNNIMNGPGSVRTGIASDPVTGEWIINEILFDPRPSGGDYLELFNNGHHIFDASRLYIANRNSSGTIASVKPISSIHYFIYPGDHIVLTEDAAALDRAYFLKDPDAVLEMPVMPAFPETEGFALALNANGNIVDELHYNKDWHFKLITDPEGVSLERIDPAGRTQDPMNWHSASYVSGYGTPGYKNSQYKRTDPAPETVSVSPSLFSPDNDGRDDVAVIRYDADRTGVVATVTIFNASGIPEKVLARNQLTGMHAEWKWDGLDDHGRALPAGVYIVLTRLFSTDGKMADLKNGVVLVRTL